ncbi:MAG: class I SAM-dependent methyltransferase, partial [Gemmatimonadota bacterium]
MMPRVHLIEFHDQPWCPDVLRDAATDYLQFVTRAAKPYAPVVDRLRAAIEASGADRIIDLCSGAGGPWPHLRPALATAGDVAPTVCLTDRFPNLEAFRRASADSGGGLSFDARPVDATRLPVDLVGFRTLFASFHHFRPESARAILADAVERRQGIAVLEMTHRSLPALILMGITPLLVLIGTPFVRPFRWSRLL